MGKKAANKRRREVQQAIDRGYPPPVNKHTYFECPTDRQGAYQFGIGNQDQISTPREIPRDSPRDSPRDNESTSNGTGVPTASASMKRKHAGGTGQVWVGQCQKLLKNMMELEDSKPFRNPASVTEYPRYYTVVSRPMDLRRVKSKLDKGDYSNPSQFGEDIDLIFSNSKLFFQNPNSIIFSQTNKLSWWFRAQFNQIRWQWEKESKRQRLSDFSAPSDPAQPGYMPPQQQLLNRLSPRNSPVPSTSNLTRHPSAALTRTVTQTVKSNPTQPPTSVAPATVTQKGKSKPTQQPTAISTPKVMQKGKSNGTRPPTAALTSTSSARQKQKPATLR